MDMMLLALLNSKIDGLASGIDSAQVNGQTITFTMKNGSQQTMTFPTPKDGENGKSVIISKIENISGGSKITFSYFGDDSIQRDETLEILNGKNGLSVVDARIEEGNRLILKLSDGSEIDAGTIMSTNNADGSDMNLSDYYNKLEIDKIVSNLKKESIKKIHFDETTNIIKFFKDENALINDVADFEIDISNDIDTSNFIEKLGSATNGNIVLTNSDGNIGDSGISLQELVTDNILTERLENKLGNLDELLTVSKSNIVEAVNEIKNSINQTSPTEYDDTHIKANIGNLEDLTTSQKGSLVNAINEINSEKINKSEITNILDGLATENYVTEKINEAQINGGNQNIDMSIYVTNDMLGDINTLTTTDTSNLVNSINEIHNDVNNIKTESKIDIEEDTQNSDFAKVYIIKQNSIEVSRINIPKDMVVKSGQIVENPTGYPNGKYVELTISNGDADKVYINVADLVDAYTYKENATQIQLSISNTNEISASIVKNSITELELADNSVTPLKLSQDVKGLFDSVGSANKAQINAQEYCDQKFLEITTIGTDEIDSWFEDELI